jgi:hypothetical protein
MDWKEKSKRVDELVKHFWELPIDDNDEVPEGELSTEDAQVFDQVMQEVHPLVDSITSVEVLSQVVDKLEPAVRVYVANVGVDHVLLLFLFICFDVQALLCACGYVRFLFRH